MDAAALIWFGIGAFVLILILHLLSTPLMIMARVLAGSMIGAIALYLINAFMGWTGFHLPVNPVSAVIAGMLGLPGVLALAMIRVILV